MSQPSRREFIQSAATTVTALALSNLASAADRPRRVVVWSEGTAPKDVYPADINSAVAAGLAPLAPAWEVVVAGIDQPDQGLDATRLAGTDVLIWWGHKRHDDVKDDLVRRIVERVKTQGMGFIGLHSAHYCKPYRALMGTACGWREYVADGTSVTIHVKQPDHPIARGIQDFHLPKIERYGEPFVVPEPEAVVLEGEYLRPDGGKEKGRMGLCWTVGRGRVFYFTPGHETYPDFLRDDVRHVLRNAVEWAAPRAA